MPKMVFPSRVTLLEESGLEQQKYSIESYNFKNDILCALLPKQTVAQNAPVTTSAQKPRGWLTTPSNPALSSPSSKKHRGITEGFFKLGLTDRVPGVLEFDFVSIARPSSDTQPLTPGQFDRYVRCLPSFYIVCAVGRSFGVSEHCSVLAWLLSYKGPFRGS